MAKISPRRGVKSPFADWSVLKPELDSITRRLGHFPSERELAKIRRFDVRHAVRHHHGGFVSVQQKMGVAPKMRTGEASLTKWENFSREINGITRELGHFPSTKELQKLNCSDLFAAISTHGGVDAVRTRMGVALGQKKGTRSLAKWGNFERELRAVWEKIGHFPTWGELEALKREDLLNAFHHHGGANAIRQRFGVPLAVKSGEYSLRKWPNLEAALGPFVEKGFFPSIKWLAKNGQNDLAHAIISFPGGTNAVRRKFGFKPLKRPPVESFRLWRNAKDQLSLLVQVFGHFPTDTELIASGYASLVQAIREYHGGLRKAKQVFTGEKPKPKTQVQVSRLERRFFLNAKAGGEAGKLALIDHLGRKIGAKIRDLQRMGYREPEEDLRQQATVAILKALERNTDPNHFYGTISMAIAGELRDLVGQRHGFYIPRKEYTQIVVIAQTTRRLQGSLGRPPSAEEVSQATLIPTPQIISLRKRYPRSLFQTDVDGKPLLARIRPEKIW